MSRIVGSLSRIVWSLVRVSVGSLVRVSSKRLVEILPRSIIARRGLLVVGVVSRLSRL